MFLNHLNYLFYKQTRLSRDSYCFIIYDNYFILWCHYCEGIELDVGLCGELAKKSNLSRV